MKQVSDRAGVLTTDHLVPGQCVSVDHFVCSTKGRLFMSYGKTHPNDMYHGGCIFVDHASKYIHVKFQAHLNMHETLRSKEKYELMCRDLGVIPQQFQSDNGSPFTSKGFNQQLSLFQQIIRFAGVGAHHSNGLAERSIGTIMSISRAMMLRAVIHWPAMADSSLWPMAVSHAVFLYNHTPDPTTGLALVDVFTKTRWEQRRLHDMHPWGCPTYLLDHRIADGRKIPRWEPCSEQEVNMGMSMRHNNLVPLQLQPSTGKMTTGYHVVFDDWFVTDTSTPSDLPDFNSDEWSKLFGDSVYQYPFDSDLKNPLAEAQKGFGQNK